MSFWACLYSHSRKFFGASESFTIFSKSKVQSHIEWYLIFKVFIEELEKQKLNDYYTQPYPKWQSVKVDPSSKFDRIAY